MDVKEILKHVDHTLLTQTATWAEIKQICDDAITYGTASVCIPPAYVKQVKEYVQDKMAVCTVIGFPNGYMTTAAKEFETRDALTNGADEIDMVINIGALKSKNLTLVEEDIQAVVDASGDRLVKVIIETCLLTETEKVVACQIAKLAGADFVKTSTGFSTGGATVEDVALMRQVVGPDMGVKASGGTRSYEDAQAMIQAGANRIGTSSGVAIMKGEVAHGDY